MFGGMGFKQDSNKIVQSLTSSEVYNIKEDKWTQIQPFENARQASSACVFNEKYIFLFGGKQLAKDSVIG